MYDDVEFFMMNWFEFFFVMLLFVICDWFIVLFEEYVVDF